MNYCNQCGATVEWRLPDGDNRERFVCISCNYIHYQNPRVIAGFLPTYQDKVLLCKRAIEPRAGYWTLPAGFLENNETVEEGAIRESAEEANTQIEKGELYGVFSLPHISQIYVFYRGELTTPDFYPGEESLDTVLFTEAEIPWQELAFTVMAKMLQHYFADRKTGTFPIHAEDLIVR